MIQNFQDELDWIHTLINKHQMDTDVNIIPRQRIFNTNDDIIVNQQYDTLLNDINSISTVDTRLMKNERDKEPSHTFTVYSMLDPDHLQMSNASFRGVLYLIWLSMIGGILSTFCKNYRKYGYLLGSNLYHIARADIKIYIVAEITLMSSLFLAYLIQKMFIRELLPISWSLYIRHAFQGILVLGSAVFARYRQWPFPQTSVLILHSIAMFMKMHSYFSVNESLHKIWKIQDPVKKRVAEEIQRSDKCIYYDGSQKYPNNVTLSSFIYYLIIPSLIYQVNPPRFSRIRIGAVIEKTFSATVGLLLLYIIFEHWIFPVLFELERMNLVEAILELLFPFTVFYILLFYFVFEVLCTWCAELTRYGVRSFYDDWWNSTTFDQFARKWNKPVHRYLYHHIYEEAMRTYGLSKSYASILTFLFSSCLHEFTMCVVSGKIKFYFFFLQMLQIPLIYFGRLKIFQDRPSFSNMFIWSSLMVGTPLLALLYSRDYFLTANWQEDFSRYSI